MTLYYLTPSATYSDGEYHWARPSGIRCFPADGGLDPILGTYPPVHYAADGVLQANQDFYEDDALGYEIECCVLVARSQSDQNYNDCWMVETNADGADGWYVRIYKWASGVQHLIYTSASQCNETDFLIYCEGNRIIVTDPSLPAGVFRPEALVSGYRAEIWDNEDEILVSDYGAEAVSVTQPSTPLTEGYWWSDFGDEVYWDGIVVPVTTDAELTAAIAAARPGDTITLAAGTYSTRHDFTCHGTAADHITITGAAGVIFAAGLIVSGDYIDLSDIEVTPGSASVTSDAAQVHVTGSYNTLTRFNIHDLTNGSGVLFYRGYLAAYTTGAAYNTISDSTIATFAGRYGIMLDGHDNTADGVTISGPSGAAPSTDGDGIRVNGPSMVIRDCIIHELWEWYASGQHTDGIQFYSGDVHDLLIEDCILGTWQPSGGYNTDRGPSQLIMAENNGTGYQPQVTNLTLRNCLFMGEPTAVNETYHVAINFNNSSNPYVNFDVDHCTFWGCRAITAGGGRKSMDFKSCIFGKRLGFYQDGYVVYAGDYNLHVEGAPVWQNLTPNEGAHSIYSQDPMWANPDTTAASDWGLNADLSLSPGSPAIDSGEGGTDIGLRDTSTTAAYCLATEVGLWAALTPDDVAPAAAPVAVVISTPVDLSATGPTITPIELDVDVLNATPAFCLAEKVDVWTSLEAAEIVYAGEPLGVSIITDTTWHRLGHDERPWSHKTHGFIRMGAYVEGSSLQILEDHEQLVGRHMDTMHFFKAWDQDFDIALFQTLISRDTIPMLSWDPTRIGGAPVLLADIAAGTEDEHIAAYASNLSAVGGEVWLRFAWEMNGNWAHYGSPVDNLIPEAAGNTPELYIAAWQRVVDVVRANADNVRFMWCPNAGGWAGSGGFGSNVLPYYPGDDYVDLTGLDGYNLDSYDPITDTGSRWTSFYYAFNAPWATAYDDITTLNKPLYICETACRTNTRSSDVWVRAMFQTLRSRFPLVKGVMWFNSQSKHFEIEQDAAGLAAYRDEMQLLDKNIDVITVPLADVTTLGVYADTWALAKAKTEPDHTDETLQPFSTVRYGNWYEGRKYNIQRVRMAFDVSEVQQTPRAVILAVHQMYAMNDGEVTHLVASPTAPFSQFGTESLGSFDADGGYTYALHLVDFDPVDGTLGVGMIGEHDLMDTEPSGPNFTEFYASGDDTAPFITLTCVAGGRLSQWARKNSSATVWSR